MPRPRKPARLWSKPSTGEWIILDSALPGGQRRTGCRGESGRGAAEAALRDHLAARQVERTGPAQPHEITVGEVLALYAEGKGDEVASPETLAYCIKALGAFWGNLPCDAVKGSTCRAYATERAKPKAVEYVGKRGGRWERTLSAQPATVRRELGVLQAALNYAQTEGKLLYAPSVTLPGNPRPRDRWLTRREVARLLREASPHLRRFIIIAVTTGRRASAILALRWQPSLDSGWVDLERGVIHFRGERERETAKRKGSVTMTRRLAGHMRRWAAEGGTHVISWGGEPVSEIDTAFKGACRRAGIEGASPHTLKHTAVTWYFQSGGGIEDAISYFSTSRKTLDDVYRAHSPEYQSRAVSIMERAGR